MLIPAHLWQTYRTASPPPRAAACTASWRRFNPSLTCHYFDDQACLRFIRRWFDKAFADMYESLPIGVMKADVWRVAVVYVHGGIYADIDTECRAPISTWIPTDQRLVAAVEDESGALGNFTFAAVARHPALLHVLRTFMTLYQAADFLSSQSPTPVQDFGAGGWSMGVLQYYDLFTTEASRGGGTYYSKSAKALADKALFHAAESRLITPYASANTVVFHHTASVFWTEDYCQWREEQGRLLETGTDQQTQHVDHQQTQAAGDHAAGRSGGVDTKQPRMETL